MVEYFRTNMIIEVRLKEAFDWIHKKMPLFKIIKQSRLCQVACVEINNVLNECFDTLLKLNKVIFLNMY